MNFFDSLWNGIKRAITLPKSSNSIDEILGRDTTATLKALGRQRLGEMLGSVDVAILAPIDEQKQRMVAAAQKALGGSIVASTVVAAIQEEADRALMTNIGLPIAVKTQALYDGLVKRLELEP